MINREFKCIFIEVPKTGSTSIRKIVGEPRKPHLDMVEIENKILEHFPFENFHNYTNIDYIYRRTIPRTLRAKLGRNVLSDYYKFGFVRNPWSRTVSLYNRTEGIQMRNKMSFEEFVQWIEYSSDTCLHPSRKVNQIDWFKNAQGEIAIDYIGKFESLNEDWSRIAKQLGTDRELPHLNQNKNSTGKHYTEYYNSTTREIIRRKFIGDIEYLGYDFE